MKAVSQPMLRACTAGIAALMLVGCGGAATQNLPISTAFGAASQIAPALSRGDLIYVSNVYSSTVDAITYPRGKLAGTVSGDEPQGLCTSTTTRGNWWVVNSGSETIAEYAHGGTSPIATLSTTSAGDPVSCAIDPTSGDLAATLITTGAVVIFKNASGPGTEVQDGLVETFFDAYDGRGNLFADGFNDEFIPALVELRKGASTFHTVTVPLTIESFPNELFWDGTYIAVGPAEGGAIDRLAIKRYRAVLKGTVQATGASGSFWIGGSRLVAFDGQSGIGIWKYPAGGNPIKTITVPNPDLPIGLTVSLKPR